jgi:FixJ family two-component response regulator
MARTKKSLLQEKSALSPHTFTLASDVVTTLQRLSRDASDFLGWPISSSAIVRALVRQVDQQADQYGPSAVETLFLLVEKELKEGVTWGEQTCPNDTAK